jgi:threonine/homoserine/homoserine lactone efflux protein
MAVASFVLGLVGLVVLNVILGPVAIVLAVLALRRDTPRRFRAQLGLALGIADLLLLAVLVTVNGGVAWTAFG